MFDNLCPRTTEASNETPSGSVVTYVAPLLLDAPHKQILAPRQELPDTIMWMDKNHR